MVMTMAAVVALVAQRLFFATPGEVVEVREAYERLRATIAKKDFRGAYKMCTPRYQLEWSFATFKSFHTDCGPPDAVMFDRDVRAGSKFGVVVVRPTKHPNVEAGSYEWVKVDGQWFLNQMYFYPW